MDRDTRLKRLRFRAWHRGTKEADLLIGGFFDRHSASWTEPEIDWYETLLEEQDVDI
ncbi:MAG: succinate dehydrogenase assembly factor 2, partial [Pseudomonadota bacterium]|nr:succinate dehydrogenase assembly factor 2 [Pseudomonadota bacterium]